MSQQNQEPRYDDVRIENIVDGTIIEGHDAVKKYLKQEQQMMDEYGASIFFQVYRLNLQADTLEELQGKKLAEIKVDGGFVSKTDTVAEVKNKLRSLLQQESGSNGGQAPVVLDIEAADRLTFYLSGAPLQDEAAFYSVNPIILPVWIQVLLHRCESEEAVQLINKLQK